MNEELTKEEMSYIDSLENEMYPNKSEQHCSDKAKMLAKYTGHYPDLLETALLNEATVTPKDVFVIMDEYADQENKQLKEKITELETIIAKLSQKVILYESNY